MRLLVFCALIACLAGCIPIGIRGTSITATDSPSSVARLQNDTPLRPGIGAAMAGVRPARAPTRCA